MSASTPTVTPRRAAPDVDAPVPPAEVEPTPPQPHTATQLRHPWRATVRTAAFYLVSILALIPAAAPIMRDYLGGYLPPRAIGGIMWLAGLAGALLAVIQRVALTAPAAKLLARLGLGTGHDTPPSSTTTPTSAP